MEGAKKQSKGRQRIEIKKVESESKRQVTFSKRKMGMFNKAAELNILTGAKVAAMVFSPHNKVFSFGTPNCKSVIDTYFHTTSLHHEDSDDIMAKLSVRKHEILEDTNTLEQEKKKKIKTEDGGGFWWDCSIYDHENMSLEEIKNFKKSMLNLKENVEKRIMELMR